MNEGFLNPQAILKNIPLKEGMVACDFGCGSGGWVIPLARQLQSGTVYAIDILPDVISALEGKISSERLFNIKAMVGNVEKGVKLKDESVDLVLMTNLLFQVDDRYFVMEEAKRILRPEGIVLIVDWNKDAPIGSPEGRLSLGEAKEMAARVGLSPEKEFNAGNFHWALILRKI